MKAITLILIILLSSSAVATSDCVAGSAYPVVCKCDSGRIERYYNAESFSEARKDKSSCCYYDSTKVAQIANNEPILYKEHEDIQNKIIVKELEVIEDKIPITVVGAISVGQSPSQESNPQYRVRRPRTLTSQFLYLLLASYQRDT